MRAESAPGSAWESSVHARSSRAPNGRDATHDGGGGSWSVGSERTSVINRSDCSMIVSTAR